MLLDHLGVYDSSSSSSDLGYSGLSSGFTCIKAGQMMNDESSDTDPTSHNHGIF